MMINARDVANFFALCTTHPAWMTNMRANKLAYYAQAWSLVRFGKPLFNENIEAWEHGPVIPSVYHAFSEYRNSPIPTPEDTSFLSNLSEDELQLLVDVAREYDGMSTWQLRNMSHSKSEPWAQIYDRNARHTIIPIDSIESCFRDMEPLPSVTLDEAMADIPIVNSIPGSCDDGEWNEV